jgi:hypothetical protein
LNNTYIAEQISESPHGSTRTRGPHKVTQVAKGRIVKKDEKSERYEALSPTGKKIADAAEVIINTVVDTVKDVALDAIDKWVNKKDK